MNVFTRYPWLNLGLLLVVWVAPAMASENEDLDLRRHGVVPEKYFEVLNNYCLDCHDEATAKGEVNLEALPFKMDTVQSAELWQKVLNMLNSGEMPPEDENQLTATEKTDFLADLSAQMVMAREALSDSGGVITMRRLNRREYENTIEDGMIRGHR
jgi:hypothetical protein